MPVIDRIEQVWQRLHRWALWWLLAILTLFFGYDLFHDFLNEGIDFHIVLELLTVCVVTVVLVVEWRGNKMLSESLEMASSHSRRLSGELSDYVRAAFSGWSLSKSEQEVAWLLLKGFTFAEIATQRGVQETTVRQQATGIYAKSGCKNRNEFLAYFIQDLLGAEQLTGEPASAAPAAKPLPDVQPAAPVVPVVPAAGAEKAAETTRSSVRVPE